MRRSWAQMLISWDDLEELHSRYTVLFAILLL